MDVIDEIGLHRHEDIVIKLVSLKISKEDTIEICRLIDDLVGAAAVDALRTIDTPEKKEVFIKAVYKRFEGSKKTDG